MRITDYYRQQNWKLHQENELYGTSGALHANKIRQLAAGMGLDRILDYGAGKCQLANALPHLHVTCYDPCIPELAQEPEPHNFVVCTDVLEHIEPECLDDVLDHIQALTLSYAFLSIYTGGPSLKHLPDGRNAHLIQQGWDFWLNQVKDRFDLCWLSHEPPNTIFLLQAKKGPAVKLAPHPGSQRVGV